MKHLKSALKQREEQTKTRDLAGRRVINRILRGGTDPKTLNTSVNMVAKTWYDALLFMNHPEEAELHKGKYVLTEIPENIVLGTVYVGIEKLKPFEHTGFKHLQHTLDTIKQRRAIFSIAITPDFIILDGHHRVETCRMLNVQKVPCTIINLDAPEIRTGNIKVSKQRIREVADTNIRLPPKSTRITVMEKPLCVLSTRMKIEIP
jgi:hypothetical protein